VTKSDEKIQTIETYNKSILAHVKKFNEIGARVNDIKKACSYVDKINPKIIEIGCGNGRDAMEIIKYTDNYLGIDLSREMIRLAQRNVPNAKFKLANLETYRFPNKIDIIFSFASLLHSDRDSVRDILKKAYKKLNHKGIFFISLKQGEYHKEIIDKENHGLKTYYFYSPEEIKRLSPLGLEVIYQEAQLFRGQKWFTVILQKANN